MPLKHIEAYDVFPPEIVEEIQRYYFMDYLWIAKPKLKTIGDKRTY